MLLLFIVLQTAFSGVLRTAIAGSVGGMTLWTAIFPADVVKSRMQVIFALILLNISFFQVTGVGKFLPMLTQIAREEGIRGLYKVRIR